MEEIGSLHFVALKLNSGKNRGVSDVEVGCFEESEDSFGSGYFLESLELTCILVHFHVSLESSSDGIEWEVTEQRDDLGETAGYSWNEQFQFWVLSIFEDQVTEFFGMFVEKKIDERG